MNIGNESEDGIHIQSSFSITDVLPDNEIAINRLLNIYDLHDIERAFYPENQTIIHYIYLDADNRLDMTQSKKLSWELNYESIINRQGVVNVNSYINRIQSIEISDVSMNNRTGLFPLTDNWQDNQRLPLLINELYNQSVIGQDSTRYTFRLKRREIKYNDRFIAKTPKTIIFSTFSGKSIYKLFTPILSISTITIQLEYGLDKEFYKATINMNNPSIILSFADVHNILYSNFTVSNCSTGDSALDALINKEHKNYIIIDNYTINLQIMNTNMSVSIINVDVFVSSGFSVCLKITATE